MVVVFVLRCLGWTVREIRSTARFVIAWTENKIAAVLTCYGAARVGRHVLFWVVLQPISLFAK